MGSETTVSGLCSQKSESGYLSKKKVSAGAAHNILLFHSFKMAPGLFLVHVSESGYLSKKKVFSGAVHNMLLAQSFKMAPGLFLLHVSAQFPTVKLIPTVGKQANARYAALNAFIIGVIAKVRTLHVPLKEKLTSSVQWQRTRCFAHCRIQKPSNTQTWLTLHDRT